MSGNVWELAWNFFVDPWPAVGDPSALTDDRGPANIPGGTHPIRGGSVSEPQTSLSYRTYSPMAGYGTYGNVGFRVVRR
jgi:formylglycine-generating enzyme required for sulfatase activity